jgi:hypothetical protein
MQLLLWKGHLSMKKTLTLAAVLVTAALFSVGVSPAQAAPVADQTQSGLTGTNIQASILQMGPTVIGTTDIGSSFTAGLSGQLTSIEVQVSAYSSGSPAHGAQAKVWSVDGSGLPTGAALATQTIPVASLAAGALTVDFTTPANVTAGTHYVFTIGFIETTGAFMSQLSFDGGIAPAGKRVAGFASGGTPYLDTAYGINFTTYVDEGDSEGPSTGASAGALVNTGASESVTSNLFGMSAGLLAVGALAWVAARRRPVNS